ncbi:hypothetical protein AAF712_006522 [Marasmius tenuissimus]|uniref:Uncharacterized protein n=1 Tax=Marasmius tenuissimus TaxID=585030 RepID=A0ABR2ZZJ4_9AGAR
MSAATASASFTPNGLLGSSSLLEGNEFASNGLFSDEMVQEDDGAIFKPTGLLDSGPSNDEGAGSFGSNGLLGDGFAPNGLLSESKSIEQDVAMDEDSFLPTGLLGSSSSGEGLPDTDSFIPTGLLSNVQEPPSQLSQDELPPLHEAFQHSTRTDSSRTIPSLGILGAPSKYTVKATTYDGKNIFLRKKSKAAASTPPTN